MKLLMMASNRPEASTGLKPRGKTVRFDNEERKWVSEGQREPKQVTLHPVDVQQGVC